MDTSILIKSGVALSVAFIICKVMWRRLTSSKSKNPFMNEEEIVFRPIENDQKIRNKVLRKAFRSELIPENLDAIVVGSGIGGLTCAGLLARSGKRVLVLEKHDRAGGTTHTYESQGFEFDIGIHVVGNMENGSPGRCLIDLITDKQLHWAEVHEQFDKVVLDIPDKPVQMYSWVKGIKNCQKQLLANFPQETKAIEQFFKLVHKCKSATNILLFLKFLPKTLLKVLSKLGILELLLSDYNYLTRNSLYKIVDDLTEDQDLRAVLGYSYGDYGSLPKDTSFLMHGMLINHLARSGCYYPKGGPSEIAYQVIPGIERAGGAVLTGANVEEIIVESGKACGVRVSKVSSSLKQEVRAPIVISAAGIYNTYKGMLSQEVSQKYQVMKGLDCIKPGLSCLQIMVGLNGTPQELGLQATNYWIFNSNDLQSAAETYLSQTREDAVNSKIPMLFASFPGSKDPTWNERFPNKSTCVIVTLCNLDWFEEWKDEAVQNRGRVYNDFKSNFVNQVWEQVLAIFPHLKDKVEHMEGGTPLSHVHYLNSRHGEMYGMNHNKERFQYHNAMEIRPETPIPGLFLTGQDVFSCGFSGAAFAGLLSASKVLQRNLMFDLLENVKKVRKENSAKK